MATKSNNARHGKFTSLHLGKDLIKASGAEINAMCDASSRLVAAGATLTLTKAAHENKIILLDTAAGSVVTLPASSGSGAVFKFLVSTTVTSNESKIVVANATDVMRGVIVSVSDGSDNAIGWKAQTTSDTIELNGTTKGGYAGDWIEVVDYAAGFWAVRGQTASTGTEATPFDATVA